VRIDASGNATYVFSTRGRWWKAGFDVPPSTVDKLRQLLVDVDYLALDRTYHAAVFDGTQWCIRVEAAGVSKNVY
jgi:hypothetical protein